jgi:hypothetical protein
VSPRTLQTALVSSFMFYRLGSIPPPPSRSASLLFQFYRSISILQISK